MNAQVDPSNPVSGRAPLILGGHDFHSVTEIVSSVMERKTPRGWWVVFAIALVALQGLAIGVPWLFWEGIGIWGLNVPVGWAWDITNFVFWVGIGHAGTLISAILLLFRQKWRTSINRAAEAMTIFAVLCALTYPGSTWAASGWRTGCSRFEPDGNLAQLPKPAALGRFAVSIYGTVWPFLVRGAHPRPRHGRERAKTKVRKWAYGLLALGWVDRSATGSTMRSRTDPRGPLDAARALGPLDRVDGLRGLSTPGWHTTIFPPYFVAAPSSRLRHGRHPDGDLPVGVRPPADHHHAPFDYMAKIILVTGCMVGYAYATEFFTAWYSANEYESRRSRTERSATMRGPTDYGELQRHLSAASLVSRGSARASPRSSCSRSW